MEKWDLKKLLAKVDNFVALVSFADAELTEIFKRGLSLFLGVDFSEEDFQAWVQKNSNYLGDKLGLQWMLTGSVHGNFLETPFGQTDKEEYIFLRIYKNPPASKDDFKVKESAMLQSSGAIPALYYYKVIPFFFSGLEKIDKKYSAYMFLAEGIQRLFGLGIDDVFINNFTALVTNNTRLRSVLEAADTIPTFLGAGQEGVAYSIGPSRVLKIFKQKASLQHAINAIRRLHQSPDLARTEAMIYDAGELGTFGNVPVYFYIIEKMIPVSKMEDKDKKLVHDIITNIKTSIQSNQDYWEEVQATLMDPRAHAGIKTIVRDNANVLANQVKTALALNPKDLATKFKLQPQWLESLCEEIIMKLLTNRDDLHIGNLGITGQGEFRYFDPSFDHSSTPTVFNPNVDKDAQTL